MVVMKRLVWLFCAGAVLASATDPNVLTGIHTVYMMPMYRGLDQYLANRLTTAHVFQVVTDPKQADAVFTDRLGEAFQSQLETMFPPPEPAAAPAPPATAPPDKQATAEPDAQSSKGMFDTVNKLENPSTNSTFGRGKGTIFLVDARTSRVIWSAYRTPVSSGSREMDHAASELVEQIRKDMGTKKK
jgi:hypothetical protein